MAKQTLKKGKRGVKPALMRSRVSAMVAYLPILRRFKRTYRFTDLSAYLSILMAHNGPMAPTRLCIAYYGDKDMNKYKYTQYALVRLRDNGLAESVGGKWQLTEKGMRELGLID